MDDMDPYRPWMIWIGMVPIFSLHFLCWILGQFHFRNSLRGTGSQPWARGIKSRCKRRQWKALRTEPVRADASWPIPEPRMQSSSEQHKETRKREREREAEIEREHMLRASFIALYFHFFIFSFIHSDGREGKLLGGIERLQHQRPATAAGDGRDHVVLVGLFSQNSPLVIKLQTKALQNFLHF